MTQTKRPRPVVLCVLDGWGYREERVDNAIAQAHTPNWDRLWSNEPTAFLEASEEEVGLPQGQMGNSEVGHMNLGAGRVVMQDLVMIDHAIVQGEFERNAALQDMIRNLKASGGRCHLMGLLSPGGVHSHQDHMAALAAALSHEGIPVEVHAFTDGRDVPPQSAVDQVAEFMADVHELPGVTIATVIGRYWAMDRDKRWERVAKAYAAMVRGEGEATAADPIKAIEQSYAIGKHDEFIAATVIDGYTGMKDGDAILMANFRADRTREILTALVDPAFDGFERGTPVTFAATVGMVEYSSALNAFMTTIFPPKSLTRVLGEVVSEAGLKQLRIAETEKYPHVTFFFNGGEERVYPGEDRILVPSPKVATYDLQPEMSAAEVTDKLVAAVDGGTYDLVVVNYANPDMVGHSGILSAAIKAVEAVDQSLGRLEEAVRRAGGTMLVTADHGNCELMKDPETGGPHTAHTLDKVPLVLVNGPTGAHLRSGRLADVAPTLLALMGLDKPTEMTGSSLIDGAAARAAAE
ncbi:MAG TPA: 2,3-bisphosphoglycerate-independent phosphoglycerate mutase [Azospirillum sp.]|nr:2,3-bisphosphoglycerate-independent phosphoglycerate mutase [Azospirillum sp.]